MATYILFDTETTGNQERDRIIQIGALVIYSKEQIEVCDELCSSSVPIEIEAMEVHNITPDMIVDKPPFKETLFYKQLNILNQKENYLIAHNIKFDLGMLQKEGFTNNYTLIDTLRCAMHLYPDMPYHRLQYLRYALELYSEEEQEAKSLGVTIKAHDAIGDVVVMKLLLSKLVKEVKIEYPDNNVMVKLAELTTTPVLMKRFKFGKYRGESIEDIANSDPRYIAWMLKELELDDDMKYTLRYYS
jgi:DNA polymerase III epsilon subunit family exonuclease